MIAIVQRVKRASVVVEGRTVGEIGRGFLVLLGVHQLDTEREEAWIADRIAKLRIFTDDAGKMNLSMGQVGGGCLMVPNFTLCADASRGGAPELLGCDAAGEGESDVGVGLCADRGNRRASGARRVGASMLVSLENDGPVTIVIDSAKMPGV